MKKRIGRPRLPKPRPEPPVDVDESAVMTLKQVAYYLHCHYSTAWRLVTHGNIPGFRLGPMGSDWWANSGWFDQVPWSGTAQQLKFCR